MCTQLFWLLGPELRNTLFAPQLVMVPHVAGGARLLHFLSRIGSTSGEWKILPRWRLRLVHPVTS